MPMASDEDNELPPPTLQPFDRSRWPGFSSIYASFTLADRVRGKHPMSVSSCIAISRGGSPSGKSAAAFSVAVLIQSTTGPPLWRGLLLAAMAVLVNTKKQSPYLNDHRDFAEDGFAASQMKSGNMCQVCVSTTDEYCRNLK